MKLTVENVYEILDVINSSENCAISFDAGDIRVSITKGNMVAAVPAPAVAPAPAAPAPVTAAPVAAAPAAPAAAAPAAAAPAAAADAPIDESSLYAIKADVTSVFYRASSPGEPPYVEVGDEVDENTCVCLLEVMKCFRQTTAGVKGRIMKICVNDADLVEQGQDLFLVQLS